MKIDEEELYIQICDLLDSNIREKSKIGLHNLLGTIRDKLMVDKSLDTKEEIITSLEGHTTLRKKIKLHIVEGINSLREKDVDTAQAEHNFFEIANHLEIEFNYGEIKK